MIIIGKKDLDFAADTQVYLESQHEFSVLSLDENSKPKWLIGNSKDRSLKFVVREDCRLRLVQPKDSHMSVDARPIRPIHEVVSDIPVEIDVDLEPQGMEAKIKQFCAEIVRHEYGSQSKEFDTWAEMFDFDDDEGDLPLTGYEVVQEEDLKPIEEKDDEKDSKANTDNDNSSDDSSVSDTTENKNVPDGKS